MSNTSSALQVDILKDNVVDIMDKLFYEATGGKTIDVAWEAPQPLCVNPLTEAEVNEWGDSAMKISVARVAYDPRRIGKRFISANKRFAQRSSAQPFYGYRSDPIVAPSFQKVDPIGPIAKAIKAAGELAALAHRNGEDEQPIWDLVEGSFGIKLGKYKNILKPDFGASSRTDEIKLIRSPNHMLYGFNSNAPTVGTDSGKYRTETMNQSLLFNWHSMHLTMRFMGEFMVKYSKRQWEPDTTIYFAPVYSEGRGTSRTIYASNIVKPDIMEKPAVLQKSIDSTMRFLEGSTNRMGAHMGIRSAVRRLKVTADTPLNIEHIRNLASRSATKTVQLPKDVSKFREDRVVGDIKGKVDKTFYHTVVSGALKTNMSTIPTWRRVLAMLTTTLFQNSRDIAPALTYIIRQKRHLEALSVEETGDLLRRVANAFPPGFGFLVYTVLERLSPDSNHAVSEFCVMISKIAGSELTGMDTSHDEAFISAISFSSDPSVILGVIQYAYSAYTSNAHGISQILRRIDKSTDIVDAYEVAVKQYVDGRQIYWSDFYKSVVLQCQENLEILRTIASDRGIKKTNAKIGFSDSLDLVDKKVFNRLSNERLVIEISKNKTKSVLSSFSALAYRYATVVVTKVFNVSVELSSAALHGIVARQADNYARKRKTWGKKLSVAANTWDDAKKKFDTLTRKLDICEFVDNHFDPNVKWLHMLFDLEKKFKITEKSIERMLRNNLKGPDEVQENIADLEAKEVSDIDKSAFANNSFGLLADSESEEGSDNGSEAGDANAPIDGDAKNLNYEFEADVEFIRGNAGDSEFRVVNLPGQAISSYMAEHQNQEDLFAAFSDVEINDEAVKIYDPYNFSFREGVRFKYPKHYNDAQIRRFLQDSGFDTTDYKGTKDKVDDLVESYVIYKRSVEIEEGAEPSIFMPINEMGTDIE